MKTQIIFKFLKKLPLLSLILFSFSQPAFTQTTVSGEGAYGKISGTVVDAGTGETIIGANVVIAGTSHGDATDLDGTYSINALEPGEYDITVSYISYGKKTITGIKVSRGKATRVDISLHPETTGLDEVTVTARAATNSNAGLLSIQRKSLAVQDGLSSEFLNKSGDGNVASAIRRMTGVSLLNGKDVFVRGLGNRYSNVQLNGAQVPSTNPNKKEAPVDLVSSGLVDNIIVQKTYTADQPGEFSGGSVQITTKEFPEEKKIGVSYSSSYNSESTFNNTPASRGSKLDVLGFDDGKRTLPSILSSSRLTLENETEFARALHQDWLIRKHGKAIPSQKFSLSYSDQLNEDSLPIGLVSNFSYSYNQSFQGNKIYREIQSYNAAVNQNVLSSDFLANRGAEHVGLSGMINLFIKPGSSTKIGLKNLYSNELTNSAETVTGAYINYPGNTRQTVLDFDRRSIHSSSIQYETVFQNFFDSRLQAGAGYSSTQRNRPDRRTTQYNETSSGNGYNIYFDDGGNTHYFEQQRDNNYSAQLDYQIRTSDALKVKTGVHVLFKKRNFRARRFEYQNFRNSFPSGLRTAPPDVALDPELIAEDRLDIIENTQSRDSYQGEQTMYSAYVSTVLNPVNRLTLELGARMEDSDQEVFIVPSGETRNRISDVDHMDILPAANLTYHLSQKTNLRGAFSMTLARPAFREISDFQFQDFTGSQIVYGNPALERTRITNYDLRVETYPSPGELFAVSVFYKQFFNPIELFYRFTERTEVQFKNGKNATLYGIELEGRKSLTPYVQIVANAAFIESETVVREADLFRVANKRRPMYGQSPYTFNLSVFYAVPSTNLSLSTTYNTFGRRVVTVGMKRHPGDEYEQPFHSINFGAEYRMGSFSLSAGIENLLNEDVVYRQGDLITNKYRPGMTFDFGVKYSF